MGTNELGWSAARFSAVRFLALTLSVSTAALALCAHKAHAADPKKSRDKIVEFNKQALLSYEAKDFETAKELLTKALKEAKQSGLEDDKMTARTYLHMGAVYWVGFQDQAVALQNFALAKKIRPDIQLTPSIETADLKSVFDLAVAEPEPAPVKPVTPVRPQAQSRPTAAPTPQLSGDDGGEPDLPSSMRAPLMCAVPDVVPPGKEMSIRCALKPGLNAKVVQLHHRAPGVEAYQVLAMRKTAKGWFIATLPGHVMKPGNLQVYFDARDASDNELASNGHVDSPSVIEVRKKGAVKLATTEDCSADDPMCNINRGAIVDAYEAGLHRRREGAIWVGFGGGVGWGFAPAGTLEWETQIHISAVTTTTGLFHLLPELGWMYSDTFALAVQARVEFIQQQQGTWKDPNDSTGKFQLITPSWMKGAPTNMALAVLGRAIWYADL
ncbi:MAG TPA: tetratricopeptide repeat protein, partial [Polyangia bacterium]